LLPLSYQIIYSGLYTQIIVNHTMGFVKRISALLEKNPE